MFFYHLAQKCTPAKCRGHELVEAAGIEPASASDSLSALHAYPSY